MLTALSLVVILICLYVSAGLLLLWAVDLDGYARTRLYPTPATQLPPLDRCAPGRVPWSCLP